jgi:ATP phosphoribosyltransferase regulatory subunit
MSAKDRWLLPEGIEEVLPDDAQWLESLRRKVLDLLATWGYEFVMPPMIEYLDALLTGTGKELDLQTFKVTDQLTGRLMGVRPDMTPQAARIETLPAHASHSSLAQSCSAMPDPKARRRFCVLWLPRYGSLA